MSKQLNALVLLVARAEFAAEQLTIAIDRGASVRVLDVLVAQRVAALEELAEHLRLVPVADDAFLSHDKHVPHARKHRNPAA